MLQQTLADQITAFSATFWQACKLRMLRKKVSIILADVAVLVAVVKSCLGTGKINLSHPSHLMGGPKSGF